MQWTYFGYLGAIKEMNGAAMSLGRVSTFFDIYIERDLAEGKITEDEAQELIDQFVIKLRIVRFLRTPDTMRCSPATRTGRPNASAAWRSTAAPWSRARPSACCTPSPTSGPAPEPNMTVLWSQRLPEAFKRYCIAISADTSSIQYENDDLMLAKYGDDYGIACCVSAMRLGKQMQFFGARVNLAKCMLYAINGGRDEMSGKQVGPAFRPVAGDVLDYDDVMAKFDDMMAWLARTYVHAMNCIHYSHDRYNYERLDDGAARPRHPAHHGLRHRRPVGRRRQPLGDQVCEGEAGAQRGRAGRRLRDRRANSRCSATTIRAWTTSRPTW